jgi:hypothetical protein
MTENTELGQSRLDSLYVIADPIFDTLESALADLEMLVGVRGADGAMPLETGERPPVST